MIVVIHSKKSINKKYFKNLFILFISKKTKTRKF